MKAPLIKSKDKWQLVKKKSAISITDKLLPPLIHLKITVEGKRQDIQLKNEQETWPDNAQKWYKMALKHMKLYSTLLIIREMQIKSVLR